MTIMRCTCEYPFQDERYGKGMRLFNDRANGKPARCTVCGREAKTETPPKKKA